MELTVEYNPEEIAVPLPETEGRHKRYLEDMSPEQREEILGRFFNGIIKEPLDSPSECKTGGFRVHRCIEIGTHDKPALIFTDINDYEAEWVLSL